jgi:hypothetical protein
MTYASPSRPISGAVSLSERAIEERLAAYNGDGTFGRRLAALWARVGEDLVTVCRRCWDEIPVPNVDHGKLSERMQESQRRTLRGPVDAEWVRVIAAEGLMIVERQIPTPVWCSSSTPWAMRCSGWCASAAPTTKAS